MSPSRSTLTETLRGRLQRLEREREHLLALLEMYGKPVPVSDRQTTPPARAASPRRAPSKRSRAAAGGPVERVLTVLRQAPGLRYAEIIERAKVDLKSAASNPERSIGSAIQSLIERGRIERRDGKHYPVARP